MDNRTKNALMHQLGNINMTIENAKNLSWRKDPERDARLQWESDELARMIENDIAPQQSAIMFADVLDAREVCGKKYNIYANEDAEHQYAMDKYHDALSAYISASHDGSPDDVVEAARKRCGEINVQTYDLAAAELEYKKARLVYQKVMDVHVKQCEVIVLRALLDDLSWTKQPTRYKHMRKKAMQIADAALIGTGCCLNVYENGAMTVTYDYAATPGCSRDGAEIKLHYVHDYDNDMPNIECMTKRLERYESGADDVLTLVTYGDVIKAVDAKFAAMSELRKLRDEYVERVSTIIKPLIKFELHRELSEITDVNYYEFY